MRQAADNRKIPMTSIRSGVGTEVLPDIYYYTNQIVNVIFVGTPGSGDWVLIDAGMPFSADKILKEAQSRFGNIAPRAIILTHGHFDHVGSITGLLEHWSVPVFSHPLEMPFLTGLADYPEADNGVEGGGALAKMSFMYPHKSINIKAVLKPLPSDGTVPFMPGWRWLHTPGHSPGHVSYYRESDRTLIAGDAFITVRVDAFFAVLVQKAEVNGPPRYFTTDWETAYRSVMKLAALNPRLAITGHGRAMKKKTLRPGLKKLASEFETFAMPRYGKYIT